MNIFGMGAPEIGIILVAALIIFGPGKLPEVMGQMGRAVRDFRRMTSDLTGEFEKAVGDPNELKRALTGEIEGVKSTVAGTASTAKRDLKQVSTTVGKTVTGATKSTTTGAAKSSSTTKSASTTGSGTAAKSTAASRAAGSSKSAAKATAAAATASKADPLSDVLLFEPDPEPAPAAKPAVPAARRATSSASPVPNAPTNGTVAIAGDDPVARARQRRLQAGYGAGRHASTNQTNAG